MWSHKRYIIQRQDNNIHMTHNFNENFVQVRKLLLQDRHKGKDFSLSSFFHETKLSIPQLLSEFLLLFNILLNVNVRSMNA